MIDFHCHFVGGIDDGTNTIDAAVSNLILSYKEGVGTVVLTPHIYSGLYDNKRQQLLQSIDAIKDRLLKISCPIEIIYGAEVFMDENLIQNLNNGDILTINDAGKYILTELPYIDYPVYADSILFEIQCKGITPILAHPERNRGIRKEKNILQNLIDNKILIQLDAGSLVGKYGKEVQNFAQYMIQRRMAHILGSDYHKTNDKSYSQAAKIIEYLTDREYMVNITRKFPQMVLDEKEINIKYNNIAIKKTTFEFMGIKI